MAISLARRLLALLAFAALPSHSDTPLTRVADLRYGVALYHYYQQDYLPALAELMVAERRGGIAGHGDNPELIAGGVSLAFGMHQHAQGVFSALLQDDSRPQSVRDAAWFYLGKIHYLHGDWPAAEASFARVSPAFEAQLRDQMQALRINMGIHQRRATSLTPNQVQLGSWTAYSLYNLGAAKARAGQFSEAQAWFAQLRQLKLPADAGQQRELWALQDKAHTAQGYSFLAEKNPAAAEGEFKRVRLAGPYANQALLGYGWALAERGAYAQALQPWQQLRQRSLIHPPVQEALLALPYAYEKLGAKAAAMAAYQEAQTLLERELALIRSLRGSLSSSELIARVASEPLNGTALRDWAAQPIDAPDIVAVAIADSGNNWLQLDQASIIRTRANYLSELFAQNPLQAGVLQMRDLLRLQNLLHSWQPKLEAYQDLLQQRLLARQQQQQQFARYELPARSRALALQRDSLAQRIATLEQQQDYLALAEGDLQQQVVRLKRAEAALQQLQAAGRSNPDAAARLQLLRGLLLWQAAQSYPQQLAALQAQQQHIDEGLGALAASGERIAQLFAQNPDITPLQQRLQQQSAQINAQLARTQQLLNAQAELLYDQVDVTLALHEQRLTYYQAQAHLSLARLQDQQLREAEPWRGQP